MKQQFISEIKALDDRKVELCRDIQQLLPLCENGNESVRDFIEEKRSAVDYLDLLTRFYDSLSAMKSQSIICSSPQLDGQSVSISRLLQALRVVSGQTQANLASVLEVSQSTIARQEASVNTSAESKTISAWANSCGYDTHYIFTKRVIESRPTIEGLDRLALISSLIKSQVGTDCSGSLEGFLGAIRKCTGCDDLTCFLGNDETGTLHQIYGGLDFQRNPMSAVRRRRSPWRYLNQKPCFIQDALSDDWFSRSSYTVQNGIRSVLTVPFKADRSPGLLFLNYKNVLDYDFEIESAMDALGHIAGYFFSGMVSQIFPIYGRYRPETAMMEVSSFIEVLLAKRNDLASTAGVKAESWTSSIVDTLLLWLHENIGTQNSIVSLHRVTGDGKSVELVNGAPFRPSKNDVFSISDASSVVAFAAKTRQPVIVNRDDGLWHSLYREIEYNEDAYAGGFASQSEIAVPVANSVTGDIVAVLNAESADSNAFKSRHVDVLEAAGHVLTIVLDTCAVIKRAEDQRCKPKVSSAEIDRCVESIRKALGDSDDMQQRLRQMAEFICTTFGAYAVDIWPVNWRSGNPEFDIEHGAHYQDCVGDEQDFWYAPRVNGNSSDIVRDPVWDVKIYHKGMPEWRSVCEGTKEQGVVTVAGVAVLGPSSYKADGIIWVRFKDPKIDSRYENRFSNELKVIAGFTHLIWNPTQYFASVGSKSPREAEAAPLFSLDEECLDDKHLPHA